MTTQTLDQLLISQVPRENAGSRAFNRFAFQNDWALCHLLTLHEGNEDYLLVFDYHDDVLELNAESDPTSVKFFQVKTSRGKKANWTPKQLLARSKDAKEGRKLSFLGKLYHHTKLFEDKADGLFFVSNLPLKVDLEDDSDSKMKERLSFNEFSEDEQQLVKERLREEHDLDEDPSLDDFCFIVTPLSLDEHQVHSLGHVTKFLTDQLARNSVPSNAFFQTLSDEIKRCASWEYQPTDWKSFCEKKGISRARMVEYLASTECKADSKVIADQFFPDLEKGGVSFGQRQKLRHALRLVEIEMMSPDDTVLHEASEELGDAYEELMGSEGADELELTGILDALIAGSSPALDLLRERKSDEYLKALSMVIIYE